MEVPVFKAELKVSFISRDLTAINVTDSGPWALQLIEIDGGQVEIPGKTFIGTHAGAQGRQHKVKRPLG